MTERDEVATIRRRRIESARALDERRSAWEALTGITVGRPHPCPSSIMLPRGIRHPRNCIHDVPGLVFDHWYLITDVSGRRGVLTMPYDLDYARLSAWCESNGATWESTGEGWWWPGTKSIVIWPKARS